MEPDAIFCLRNQALLQKVLKAMPNSPQNAVSKAQRSTLPNTGFVRLASIIASLRPLPTLRSTWFAWQREGRAPAPIQLPPRITAYRAEDVHALLAELSQADVSR